MPTTYKQKQIIYLVLLVVLAGAAASLHQAWAHADTPPPQARPAIVGGEPAAPGEFPWMAALFQDDIFRCGGSLVAEAWIVTAAHCIAVSEPAELRVALGVLDHTDLSAGQVLTVTQVLVHPDFAGKPEHDIALLQLGQPADTTRPSIALVELADPLQEPALTVPGTPALVAGWGATNPDRTEPSDVLLKVSVPITSTSTTLILAGGVAGKDACAGDSGSPLMVSSANGERLLQVGLAHGGSLLCAQEGAYTIYPRLSFYRDWIAHHTGELLQTYLPLLRIPAANTMP